MAMNTETNATTRIALINERITGPPALELIHRTSLLTHSGPISLLDNASGIGTLPSQLIPLLSPSQASNTKILSGDIDQSYLSFQGTRFPAFPSLSTQIIDQQSPPPSLPATSFTHITSNFGIFFSPDQSAVLASTLRLLAPGGIAGFTSWAKITWWDELLLPAMRAYLPDAPALPHPMGAFDPVWASPEKAKARLEDAGFVGVQSETYDFVPDVQGQDLAAACAVLVKAVAARAWDEGQRERYGGEVEGCLRRYLEENYEGGRWMGRMSAVVTVGRKGE
ncbi:Hypothetical protein D9617_2g053190 [Elsinoe fawcettii]|nr:Hypothetical protein D9617_2g053190 [Elsinoe fawcettii]